MTSNDLMMLIACVLALVAGAELFRNWFTSRRRQRRLKQAWSRYYDG